MSTWPRVAALCVGLLSPAAAQAQLPALLGGDGAEASREDARATIPLEGPSDERIAQRLLAIVSKLEGLREVRLEVHSGVVHLTGFASSVTARTRAEDIARRLEGVAAVESDIELPTNARSRLRSFGSSLRESAQRAVAFVPIFLVGVLTLLPFLLLASLVKRWRSPFARLGASKLSAGYLRLLMRVALFLAGALLALDTLGLMEVVGAVVGALGLLGIVAGLALKDVVANYLPGALLGMHPPFKSGDLVRIGQYEGNVVRVTPHDTVLITRDGDHLRIPNAQVFMETVTNYSRHRKRRLRFPAKLAFETDLHKAAEVGRQALRSLPEVLEEPGPFMRVSALGGDQVEVEYFAWMDQGVENFRTTESRARRAVRDALLRSGIALFKNEVFLGSVRPPSQAPVPEGGPTRDRNESADQALLGELFRGEATRGGERDLLSEAQPMKADR